MNLYWRIMFVQYICDDVPDVPCYIVDITYGDVSRIAFETWNNRRHRQNEVCCMGYVAVVLLTIHFLISFFKMIYWFLSRLGRSFVEATYIELNACGRRNSALSHFKYSDAIAVTAPNLSAALCGSGWSEGAREARHARVRYVIRCVRARNIANLFPAGITSRHARYTIFRELRRYRAHHRFVACNGHVHPLSLTSTSAPVIYDRPAAIYTYRAHMSASLKSHRAFWTWNMAAPRGAAANPSRISATGRGRRKCSPLRRRLLCIPALRDIRCTHVYRSNPHGFFRPVLWPAATIRR